jgi:palmitoyltransferase ZDHHC3/7/25
MSRPGYITLPIVTVLFCICYIYYTTVFVAIEGWLRLSTAAGLANAAVITALTVICIATYITAVVKDPGLVPAPFVPDLERPNSAIHEIKRKVSAFGISNFRSVG